MGKNKKEDKIMQDNLTNSIWRVLEQRFKNKIEPFKAPLDTLIGNDIGKTIAMKFDDEISQFLDQSTFYDTVMEILDILKIEIDQEKTKKSELLIVLKDGRLICCTLSEAGSPINPMDKAVAYITVNPA